MQTTPDRVRTNILLPANATERSDISYHGFRAPATFGLRPAVATVPLANRYRPPSNTSPSATGSVFTIAPVARSTTRNGSRVPCAPVRYTNPS